MDARLLVVETQELEGLGIAEALEALGYCVTTAPDVPAGLEAIQGGETDVAFLGVGDASALSRLRDARACAHGTALVAVVTQGGMETVADAIRAGADHCVAPPLDPEVLRAVAARAYEKPELARQAEEAERRAVEQLDIGNFGPIVGSHPVMQQLLQKVLQAARSRATVLIAGETGTGKELIAAAIHENSRRAGGPFVRLNCAALAEAVLESELFGHERGAFTGAAGTRKGRFEQAAGGTLFLDEVSEIPKAIQVKLLRFLQEREFERVGSNDTIRVDVRVIAATNRDLKAMVADGSFRSDLFYRLNVVRLEVPPLRLRPSDVPLLADHFLRRFAAQEEKKVHAFSDEAMRAMLDYPWPGNVRELQNAVEQAVVLTDSEVIQVDDLPIAAAEQGDGDAVRLMIPGTTLEELERFAILRTLEAVGGSPTRAAKILGVSRRTIQYRLQEWGLTKPRKKNGED